MTAKKPAPKKAAPKKAPAAKRAAAPAKSASVDYASVSLRRAVMNTIEHLRKLEALTPAHDAMVVGVFTLAGELDEKPGSDSLWREFRLLLAQLREVGEGVGGDDDEELGAVEVAVRAKVGNAKKSR